MYAHHKKTGLPPGSLIYQGERKVDTVEIRITEYSSEYYADHHLDSIEASYAYLDNMDHISWVKITGLHDVDTLSGFGNKLEIHPLVMEDIVNVNQRSKVELYDDYIFLVQRYFNFNQDENKLESEQLSVILSDHCVISCHEKLNPLFDVIYPRIQIPKGRFSRFGADYLVYVLTDLIVDHYFNILDDISSKINTLEVRILKNPTEDDYEKIHSLRRDLLYFLQIVTPMRDMVNTLIRTDSPLITGHIRVYLGDVYDHLTRVQENAKTYIEVALSLADMYMAQISIRSNQVMKVLTIIATIFIPLTFIVGIYGMNFNTASSNWNMPELNWPYGYPIVLLFMLILTLSMIIYFKKRKWM